MFIYKITNRLNGKCYIGLTKNNPNYRFNQHKKRGTGLLKKAFSKYGEENFSLEILEKTSSLEMLNFLEKSYIEKYKSLSPKGYNLHTGGNSHEVSELTRERLKKAHLGKVLSKEHKKKISEGNKGKTITEKTRRKQSLAALGEKNHRFGKTPTNARSVIGFSTEGNKSWFFKTLSEAEKYGFQAPNIVHCCRGRLKTHKRFCWEYV